MILDGHSMVGFLQELYDYRAMIFNLVKRDLRGRYKGSVLGFLWNFILPAMQITVYAIVFTVVFRMNIEDYYVYLIAGMVPWIMFSDSAIAGAGCIVENMHFVSKIYFPRTVIPVSVVISKFINFLISVGIVLIILLVGGHGFSIVVLPTFFLAVVFLFLISLGFALFLAAADVYMKDIQYIVTVVMMLWIWLTPIMYVKNYIDNSAFQTILSINPMTYLVEMFQDVFYWHTITNVSVVMMAFLISTFAFIVGLIVFNRTSSSFVEVM